MPAVIDTRELTRTFGTHVALDRLSLQVPQGQVFGYLGLNGAGKSTTIKILATLLRPTSGRALVLGHDIVQDAAAIRRSIGYLSEDAHEARLSWSAREYVGYFAGLRGIAGRREAAEAALRRVGLEEKWWSRPMASYSTGMGRRTELARALIGEPKLLLLDEPTRGLDLPAKRHVWTLLRTLASEGTTVFVSSHELAEIRALCDDLAVIAEGRLRYCGPLGGLGKDVDEFERRLLGLLEPSGAPPPSPPPAPQ